MTRTRSPGYPSVPLQVALEYAEQIYALNRTNAIDREAAAKSMGYSGSSGASDKTIANLTHYGLAEKAGKGEIRITQLAVDILRPEGDRSKIRAMREAAFNPQLFEILREKFPDGHFSPDALKNALSRLGFQEIAIPPASRAYIETCQMLKQYDAYESYDSEQHNAVESQPDTDQQKGSGMMDNATSAGHPVAPAGAGHFAGGSDEWYKQQNERVVYKEEGEPGQYLKLVAAGELDDYLLEAIEDFLKRQRKRLSRAGKSSKKTSVYERRGLIGADDLSEG